MAIDLAKFKRLKDDVERSQREADKAAGVLESLMETLEKDYKVKTIEEAQKLLEQYETETNEAEEEFNDALEDFEREWGSSLKTSVTR